MISEADTILALPDHPDADALLAYDHPHANLSRWRACLTAKAWIGADLGCFFADAEHGLEQVQLVFPENAGFRPDVAGIDMRIAPMGSVFDLDVTLRGTGYPMVMRADLIR